MRRIPLRNLRKEIIAEALVDEEDYETLNQWRWCLHAGGYACRVVSKSRGAHMFLMHRQILGLEYGNPRQCDHINHNRLDNRRSNLRVVTQAQNHQNLRERNDTTSSFRGVCWDKSREKWFAYATVGTMKKKQRFDSEEEAALAAARWRQELMTHSLL